MFSDVGGVGGWVGGLRPARVPNEAPPPPPQRLGLRKRWPASCCFDGSQFLSVRSLHVKVHPPTHTSCCVGCIPFWTTFQVPRHGANHGCSARKKDTGQIMLQSTPFVACRPKFSDFSSLSSLCRRDGRQQQLPAAMVAVVGKSHIQMTIRLVQSIPAPPPRPRASAANGHRVTLALKRCGLRIGHGTGRRQDGEEGRTEGHHA